MIDYLVCVGGCFYVSWLVFVLVVLEMMLLFIVGFVVFVMLFVNCLLCWYYLVFNVELFVLVS